MMCINPITVWPDHRKRVVPCGKCLACLQNKRTDWSFRLQQEWKRSKSASFITLTYSPKYQPDDGVSKRHVQLFMKRLRKKSDERLRYYMVAEYGTKTKRPHYHFLIFNFFGNEKFLQSIWSHPKTKEAIGIVDIRPCNEARIHYTTKYIIQRVNHKDKKLNRPFALMSRGFGIGAFYLTDEMVSWHRTNSAKYTMRYGKKGRLPRYYEAIIWPDKDVRSKISETAKWDGIKAHRANLRYLKSLGYSPNVILQEMRNALLSRVKEKVAYTQIL